jgi:hypothetical protein
MESPDPKASLGVLGAGAAACAACCAGPVLGFLAATGIASILGALVVGTLGLLIALAVAAIVHQRRRRKTDHCTPTTGTAPLDTPTLEARP